MRNALVNWLINKASIDPNLFLLTADLGYSVLEPYQECFPDKFINVGVAEQNMVGIACGLATEGFKVYTYSIGLFPTFRCAEQLRNDIDYHNLSVVTCAVGSGVAYGNLGYSHHAIQDISLMRCLPNMVIATPACPDDVAHILDWHYANPCPLYLRLHKAGEPHIQHNEKGIHLGLLRQMSPTCTQLDTIPCADTCIIVIGFLAKSVQEILSELSINIPVFTLPLWGRPALKIFSKEITKYKTIITVEDHVLEGGFGSYVMEALTESSHDARVIPVALSSNVVGKVASESELLRPLLVELKKAIQCISQHIMNSR